MTNNAGPRLGLNENAMSLAAPALLLQAGILATCLAATARKYRRADIRAFPPGLGLILVLLVALLGGIGLGATDGFGLTDYYKIKPAWQLAAWLLVGALFGLLPLSVVAEQGAIARTLSERRRHGRRLIGLTLAIALLVVGTAWVLGRPWYPAGLRTHESNWTWSLAIVFLTLAPMGPWMWVAYMARLRVAWLALAWVLLFWIVPPVVDMAAAAFSPMQFQPEPSWITAISPPGALVLVWQHPRPTPGIGVMIQAAIAAGAWIIFIVLTRMTLAKEPSASVST
jgi:RsiW-degrading membrane proteinase PrsW (M82 family)